MAPATVASAITAAIAPIRRVPAGLPAALAACSAPGLDAVASWSQVRSPGAMIISLPGKCGSSRLPVSTLGTSILVGSTLASTFGSIMDSSLGSILGGSTFEGSILDASIRGASAFGDVSSCSGASRGASTPAAAVTGSLFAAISAPV
ncbi:hypothetical protein ACVIST_006758 [Bradyrhizobium elkanii]